MPFFGWHWCLGKYFDYQTMRIGFRSYQWRIQSPPIQILSFSCSCWQIFVNIRLSHLPVGNWLPHILGNPRFATAYLCEGLLPKIGTCAASHDRVCAHFMFNCFLKLKNKFLHSDIRNFDEIFFPSLGPNPSTNTRAVMKNISVIAIICKL